MIHSTLADYHKIVWKILSKACRIVRRGTFVEYPKNRILENY
jgi:hypothetical protein